jgi:hypothetical protein
MEQARGASSRERVDRLEDARGVVRVAQERADGAQSDDRTNPGSRGRERAGQGATSFAFREEIRYLQECR